MGKSWQNVILLLGLWAVAQALFSIPAEAQLSPDFYSRSCPKLFSIVGKGVKAAIQKETRIAASLLRLHFHDCFVQGCDGSILLDGADTEKDTRPNAGSVRGFPVIDAIKEDLERACPNVVSCADIVALASFFSVVLSGGPIWWIPLGRRDSLVPNANLSNNNLPSPFLEIDPLKAKFEIQHFGTKELVSLSGGHTIGIARCVVIKPSIYHFNSTDPSDPTVDPTWFASLSKRCPDVTASDNVTNPLDIRTVAVFDNLYFKNLLAGKGVLHTDRVLFKSASDTEALVKLYAKDQTKFFEDFAASMIKMGNLNPLTGKQGEIRKNCHVPNSRKSIIDENEQSPAKTYLKQSKGAVKFFKQAMKDAMKELVGDELEILVEKSVSGAYLSM